VKGNSNRNGKCPPRISRIDADPEKSLVLSPQKDSCRLPVASQKAEEQLEFASPFGFAPGSAEKDF